MFITSIDLFIIFPLSFTTCLVFINTYFLVNHLTPGTESSPSPTREWHHSVINLDGKVVLKAVQLLKLSFTRRNLLAVESRTRRSENAGISSLRNQKALISYTAKLFRAAPRTSFVRSRSRGVSSPSRNSVQVMLWCPVTLCL